MKPYRYLKKYPFYLFGRNPAEFIKPFSLIFLFLGLVFLGGAIFPIVSYQLKISPNFQDEIISAVVSNSDSFLLSPFNKVLGEETSNSFSNIYNWFSEIPSFPENFKTNISYYISIPQLKIFEAKVNEGVENLDKNLVQYPGTGIPGRPGNVVIFGHSALPRFFNPKNYKTVFSTLPTIKKGAEILVDYDNVRYTYLVEDLREVTPDDISILEPKYDDAYITLITCVPPGTTLRRLIVRGRLTR